MASLMHDHDEIDLLTTMPNRYANINQAASPVEQRGRLAITRFAVSRGSDSFTTTDQIISPIQKTGAATCRKSFPMIWCLRRVQSYSRHTSPCKLPGQKYSVICRSSRSLLRRIWRSSFHSWVSVMCCPGSFMAFMKKPCLQYAAHLNINSEGFCEEFKYRGNLPMTFSQRNRWFFLGHTQSAELGAEPVVITYTGNIGEGQGLHKVIPAMAKDLDRVSEFQVIGSGSSLHKLKSVVAQKQVEQCKG